MRPIPIISVAVFAIAAVLCASTEAQETIPLDRIWAFGIPGTRDVRELEPDKFGEKVLKLPSDKQSKLAHEALATQIRLALQHPKKNGNGFAVLGTGSTALKGAYEVLVKEQKGRTSFPLGSDITLVFFSHQFGRYVHLTRVERDGNTINVFYQFVPHETREVTEHFALIPITKLPNGKFEVRIVQQSGQSTTKKGNREPPAKEAHQVVCGPFSFSITNANKNEAQGP